MTEPSSRALTPSLRAPRRLARAAPWIALVFALTLGALCERAPRCRLASALPADRLAVRVCEREYARTADPSTGIRLARAYLRLGDVVLAHAIANALLVTPAQAEARRVLRELGAADQAVAPAR